jgi:chromosome segregation ATPase
MPHISSLNVNTDGLRTEIAQLEAQRNILKLPEEIERLQKARDIVLTELTNVQNQYAPEQARLEGLITEARAEYARVTDELNARKDTIPEIQADLESQKKAADKYIALIMAEAEDKGKELNARREAIRNELQALEEALGQKAADIVQQKEWLSQELAAAASVKKRWKDGLAELTVQKQALADDRAAFEKSCADRISEMKAQTTKLEELQDMLANTSTALAERLNGLETRITEVKMREDMIRLKEEELKPKWDEILKREADLETNWKTYTRAKKKLDLKLKELED